MRLLNVHTRKLEEFSSSDRPGYAILSHTWGNDEVSFSDITSSTNGKSKAGYQKIEYTCLQAVKKNLEYCWIDTCCIDKSSSSELSEAINSMFTWYGEAEICYAYLEDVQSSSVEDDLPKARWFTRGWTLQELLAPRRVEFYGKEWVSLGFKDTESDRITQFTRRLASITEIDELVLWKPAYMRGKSVAARMSWASKRKTGRPEDIAYCLMGIFGVNMPLLYGEGERAFIRLQEEIIKISDDHSIFAWDRDFDNTNSVSCLASSPSWFLRGAYVVPFGNKQYQSTSYTITNKGLQIQLPLIHRAKSGITYGLINCHWENTLTGSIGIPLSGSFDGQVFERSARHRPETISRHEKENAKPRTIYLGTRPPLELPFAAEVNLQVFDNSLKEQGYSDLEITNNPLASHHWHPEYENFNLRWLSSSQATQTEVVNLLWVNESSRDLDLAVCIQGVIEPGQSDGLGRFKARNIGIKSRSKGSDSWFTEFVRQFRNGLKVLGSDSGDSMSANCSIYTDTKARSFEVNAALSQVDVFGNEIYALTVNVK